jgi:holo-[acyl-carrier protein] synthase
MIIGTGSDIIDIRRVEKIMGRFEKRFIERCFTPAEQEKAERRRAGGTHIATYAKRFAAKEACSKALGTGFNHGVFMKDIGVVNAPSGAPTLELTGGALARLQSMLPPGTEPVIHLTLTDEPPLAQAFVIIEARPKMKGRAG